MGSRAYAVWGVGVAAYVVAVLQRTSLGVAGLEATDRFDASAGILATFAVLQLFVYAALQIPVGVVLDRIGPRKLVVAGALVMAVGQATIALAHSVPLAIVARVLVGSGDAMTFISVLRLVNLWFPPRRAPLFTQLTGILGQGGQLLSAIPLVALLEGPGWTPAFLTAASLGVVVGIAALIGLRPEQPEGAPPPVPSATLAQVRADIVTVWRHPGTRLGLWTHFTTQFSGSVFALLWGFPFLVSAQGLRKPEASAMLTLFVITSAAAGPFVGELVARHPLRRTWLVLGITGLTAGMWAIVLALPHEAPRWLLVILVLVLAIGGPGSMIGFDFARTFTPPHRLGTATGIVNVGGFVASLVTIELIGVILDARTPGSSTDYSLGDFRVALCVQFAVWAIGVWGVLTTRRQVRRRLASEGVVVPPIREVMERRRRQRDRRRTS